ncbi:TPA: hypothetical protein ACG0YY_002771, partial [Acinetobacter baumannii]
SVFSTNSACACDPILITVSTNIDLNFILLLLYIVCRLSSKPSLEQLMRQPYLKNTDHQKDR